MPGCSFRVIVQGSIKACLVLPGATPGDIKFARVRSPPRALSFVPRAGSATAGAVPRVTVASMLRSRLGP